MVREDKSLLSKVKKYGFIVFNVIMVAWLAIAYFVGTAEENGVSDLAEEPAFGAGLGLLYIGIIWVVGNVILALVTWYLNSKTPDTMHTTRV
jgi:hypothetical protein